MIIIIIVIIIVSTRPEPRELDTLLAEISLISSRTELYFKFLKRKAKVSY